MLTTHLTVTWAEDLVTAATMPFFEWEDLPDEPSWDEMVAAGFSPVDVADLDDALALRVGSL